MKKNNEQRKELLKAAASSLDDAIASLETLVNDYDSTEGPFSGAHPRTGHANSLRMMKSINKALKRGKV